MQTSHNKYNNIDPYVVNSNHFYSLKLIKSRLFCSSQLEDLEQEFMLHYLKYSKKFNPNKSSFKNYISLIFETKYKILVRKSSKNKECFNNFFFDKATNDNNKESINYLNKPDVENKPIYLTDFEKNLINDKILKTIEKMPKRLQILCRILQNHTVLEASEKLGVLRPNLYREIKEIKKYFTDAGLR